MWQQRLAALTQKKREEIWLLRDDGMTLDQLARRYGVNVGTISRTCSNRRQMRNVIAVLENEDQNDGGIRENREPEIMEARPVRKPKRSEAHAK